MYTLRIRSIFRINGTIYRGEEKTDACLSECPELIRYAMRGAIFLKRHHPKLDRTVEIKRSRMYNI